MAAKYTQANRPLEVNIDGLDKDALLITGFHGDEGISRLFYFHIDAIADAKQNIAFEQVLGQKVTIRLNLAADKPRYFSGICNRFSQGESDGDYCAYQLEIVPQFWLFTKAAQTRIFQQQSVPDILKKVLKGLDPNVIHKLPGTYPPRNYCVQYRETDFNFACRLMEEEGIFYFFTHAADGHKLVIADNAQAHPELPINSKMVFEKVIAGQTPEDRILTWNKRQELLTGKFKLWDHTFEMPPKNLEAKASIQDTVQAGKVSHPLKAGKADDREVYDYPGDYALRFDGVNPGGGDQPAEVQKTLKDNERTVGLRQQQEAAHGVVIGGSSSCRGLVSGHKFSLGRHPNADGDYVLTAIQHQVLSAVQYSGSGGEGFHYVNSFTAIPAVMPFRPQRVTPKPFVQGNQTATVVGPPGQEIFTDKYGRVKVQFHWDRDGKRDASSSCWVRVGQAWAGKRWGASFWPRIGQEVIVAFLEGNPDCPIIVGSVYNAEQMPPYLGDGPDGKHPKDNKVTGVKSNSTPGGEGFNEWRFDDTKGKEQIFFHAERNMDTRVKQDSMELVLHDRHLIVGAEKDGKKVGDQRELVYQDKHSNVKRDQVEKIEGNVLITVGKGDAEAGGNVDVVIEKNKKELIEATDHLHVKAGQFIQVDGGQDITIKDHKTETIKADSMLHVTSNQSEKVDGNQSLTVGGDQQEKVGKKHAVEAGQEIHLKAGMKVILEAGVQLTIKGPGGFVDIGPAGVTIQGTMVLINSGGAAGSGSGSSPEAPKDAKPPADAKEAQPTKPTVADDSKTGQKSAP